MGRGIAMAFAYAGHRISLIDLRIRTDDAWTRLQAEVTAEIRQALAALAELNVLKISEIAAIASRVQLVRADAAEPALRAAAMVFECLPETMAAKKAAFKTLNRYCTEDAILTSTTSSILVTALVPHVRQPERFLNMHWLNPAYVIPVVELSFHEKTSPSVLDRVRSTMASIGKVPVVCGPTPGYIVPRLQALVMNEAARMIEEGVVTAEEIDKATRFGLGLRFAALGVVEFIDYGGSDILFHADRQLSKSVSRARYRAPEILKQMMERGALGLKTKAGFYRYEGRDLSAYRKDVLARTIAATQSLGTFKKPKVAD